MCQLEIWVGFSPQLPFSCTSIISDRNILRSLAAQFHFLNNIWVQVEHSLLQQLTLQKVNWIKLWGWVEARFLKKIYTKRRGLINGLKLRISSRNSIKVWAAHFGRWILCLRCLLAASDQRQAPEYNTYILPNLRRALKNPKGGC